MIFLGLLCTAANSGDDSRKVGGLVLGVCKAESVLDSIFVLHRFSCVLLPEVTLCQHAYIIIYIHIQYHMILYIVVLNIYIYSIYSSSV